MKKLNLILALFVTAPAFAEDGPPPASIPANAPLVAPSTSAFGARAIPTVFTLTVTPQEAQLIWGAVGQLPYAQVAPLMERLKAQIQEQERGKAPASAEPAK